MEVNITNLKRSIQPIKSLLLEPQKYTTEYLNSTPKRLAIWAVFFVVVRVFGLTFNQLFYNTLAPEWLDNELQSTTADSLIFLVIFLLVSLLIAAFYFGVLKVLKIKINFKMWLSDYLFLSIVTFILTRLSVLIIACYDIIFTENNLSRNSGTGFAVDLVSIAFAAWMGIYATTIISKQKKLSEGIKMIVTISYLIIHLIVFGP